MAIWWLRLALLFFFFSWGRLVFYLFNAPSFAGIPAAGVLWAFVHGLRFDAAIIFTCNGPLMLLHAWRYVFARRVWDVVVSVLFITLNMVCLAVNVMDAEFFKFVGRRATRDIFSMPDTNQQWIHLFAQYWFLTLSTLAALGVFAFLSWQRPVVERARRKYLSARLAAIVGLSVLAGRGGWQPKPLSPTHAFQYPPAILSYLMLNTPFTLARTPLAPQFQRLNFFATEVELKAYLVPKYAYGERIAVAPGSNVVVMILESFGAEYVGALNNGHGFTPFLDELSKKSLLFENGFANGRRSIDAVPAILAGLPTLAEFTYITSSFKSNKVVGIPSVLKPRGYHSSFYHGGHNGTMHFDVFASLAGFERYVGASEYPYVGDNDGEWGIYDEPFLKFMAEDLRQMGEPFFASVFTLSSHNPFTIPEKLRGRFPTGTLPIHASIGYTDYALQEFFRVARGQPWFDHTIFIFTADHTSLSDKPAYHNDIGHYRVPIMIYDPKGRIPIQKSARVVQHADIPATVYDFLGVPGERTLFSRSMIDDTAPGRAINQGADIWWLASSEMIARDMVARDQHGGVQVFAFSDPGFKMALDPERHEVSEFAKELRAWQQYYINGLLDNRWYGW